ncbi:hypothetical protein CC86DRAFT_362582 [Ophiobolus disseminans]|uniref:Zn(2)-C6 fungal-type domain-containing protein n=1 Tax=Ophiobolus disseminans TaxID=1469910 RepID=A0A6A6ZF52_9PLEO|nr:hypothetical protein CC86DRAFT_362582 [Ophiobolus disseminans]
MPTVVSRPLAQGQRKRRTHAKSRRGCGNCKLRGVKCDELRPHCMKCKLYGVECNYGGAKTSLQLSAQGSFQVDLMPSASAEQLIGLSGTTTGERNVWSDHVPSHCDNGALLVNHRNPENEVSGMQSTFYTSADQSREPPESFPSPISVISPNATMAATIDDLLQLSSPAVHHQPDSKTSWSSPTPFWHFSTAHFEILSRFRERTALTIGDKRIAPAYRDCVCHLAVSNAFLMHMLLGLTLMHDADLETTCSPISSKRHKHAGLQHWNTGSKLFSRLLSKPISPAHRDAIWATGVIIGATSFWFVNSDNVEEVWPLKPAEPDDLAWLRLGEGKKSLWRLADPTRPDSIFYQIMKDKAPHCPSLPAWIIAQDTTILIPQHLQRIFDITPTSTIENNVYHLPLFILSRVQRVRLTHANVLSFLYFTAFITPELLQLLEVKDPRAIFVLGWWFKIIEDGDLWWMVSRAKIEGRAVRIWLQREDTKYGLGQVLDDLTRKSASQMDEGFGLPISIWAHDWQTDKSLTAAG